MKFRKALAPFEKSPSTDSVRVEAQAARSDAGIRLAFEVRGIDPALRQSLAPEAVPARRDGLWRTTCFEAFFGVAGSPAYYEFNLAPSGDWAWYAFDDYRIGMRSPELSPHEFPKIRRIDASGEAAFSIEVELPSAMFGEDKIESVSLTAILDRAGVPSHWATVHAASRPDFHLRTSFLPVAEE